MASSAPATTSPAPSPSPAPVSRPTNVVIAVLALAGMLASLQQTLVVPLIPDLPEILGVSPTTASWTVTVTILTGAVATPIVSRLADMVGKRRMIVIALMTMTAGSVLVAVGGTFVTTVLGRGLQGFAASLIPVGISIMRDALPRERVGFAVALMSATLGIGMSLGLPLSGVLYGNFGFESIFWVAAAGGVLLTVAVLALVPESTVRTPGRFDFLGAVLLSVALAAALLAVSKGGDWGWGSGEVLGLLGVSAVALVVWFPYELRVNDPMVDLRTAARRPVLLTNLASIGVAFALFVNLLASGQQLQMPPSTGYGFGLSVTQAGLAMMPAGLTMAFLAPVSGRLLNLLGGRITLLIGAGIMAASYVFRVFATGSVAEVVIGTTLVGIGAALSFASMPTLIMANVPITESASANGLNSLMRAIGGSTASAVLAAVLSSVSATAAGEVFPSLAAFEDMYWISAGTSLLAFVLVGFIPTRRHRIPSAAVSGAGVETVVHGRILPGGRRALSHAAIVTVTRLDGEPVDWARTDNDGKYAVALPGSGRYLVIANARGWAPRAEVLEFREGDTELHVELTEELALTGVAVQAGVPISGSLVLLHQGAGEFVSSTQTDEHGQFRFPLPPAGTYILTAVDAERQVAYSRKVVVTALASHVVIEVGQ
ncbi:Major facilitator superfamily MFS_1 [metagenome]|uniref:Major facilitator superfamily MFS_1 n=1 Tax=metagenome TaxID=256318 RepID=A0A2P2C9Z3_9ZZZZ